MTCCCNKTDKDSSLNVVLILYLVEFSCMVKELSSNLYSLVVCLIWTGMMKYLRDELLKPTGAVFPNKRQDLCWHVFLALHYCEFAEHKWHPVFHKATPKGKKMYALLQHFGQLFSKVCFGFRFSVSTTQLQTIYFIIHPLGYNVGYN